MTPKCGLTVARSNATAIEVYNLFFIPGSAIALKKNRNARFIFLSNCSIAPAFEAMLCFAHCEVIYERATSGSGQKDLLSGIRRRTHGRNRVARSVNDRPPVRLEPPLPRRP